MTIATVPFSSGQNGQIFLYGVEKYMRLTSSSAVSTNGGDPVSFTGSEQVIYFPNAKLYLEG